MLEGATGVKLLLAAGVLEVAVGPPPAAVCAAAQASIGGKNTVATKIALEMLMGDMPS